MQTAVKQAVHAEPHLVPVGDNGGLLYEALCRPQGGRNVGQLDSVDEGCRLPQTAVDLKADHPAKAAHLLASNQVIRVADQARIVHLRHSPEVSRGSVS